MVNCLNAKLMEKYTAVERPVFMCLSVTVKQGLVDQYSVSKAKRGQWPIVLRQQVMQISSSPPSPAHETPSRNAVYGHPQQIGPEYKVPSGTKEKQETYVV